MSPGFLDRVKDVLSSEEEEIELEPESAPEVFRERRSGELEKARSRAGELVEKTDNLLERLEEDLEEVKGYEDAADLDVVEDVAENFYNTRKRLIENLDFSEDIEEHHEDLEDFLDEFNDVSRKEGAVMKRVQKGSGDLSGTLQELMDHREEVEDFLRNGFRPMKRLEHLEELGEEVEEIREEAERLEKELEEHDTEDIEQELEEIDQEISEIKESDEWREKENMEEQLHLLEDKRSEKEKEVRRKVSKLERGLKKLIYRIENKNQEFDGDFVKLKALFNGNFRKLDSPFPELREAAEILDSEELLEERQQEKFEKAVEELESFESDLEEIREFEEDIEKVEDKLEDLDLEEKRRELEKERRSVENRLEDKENEMEDLEDSVEDKERELEDKKQEIERKLDSYLKADVNVEGNVSGSEEDVE